MSRRIRHPETSFLARWARWVRVPPSRRAVTSPCSRCHETLGPTFAALHRAGAWTDRDGHFLCASCAQVEGGGQKLNGQGDAGNPPRDETPDVTPVSLVEAIEE